MLGEVEAQIPIKKKKQFNKRNCGNIISSSFNSALISTINETV